MSGLLPPPWLGKQRPFRDAWRKHHLGLRSDTRAGPSKGPSRRHGPLSQKGRAAHTEAGKPLSTRSHEGPLEMLVL